jgi:hypothetical protein
MTKSVQILANACAPAGACEAAAPRADYTALNRMFRRQRSAFTQAVNSGDPNKIVSSTATRCANGTHRVDVA